MHWRSSPLISPNWNGSLTATGCPRSKFGVLVLFWESLKVGDAKLLLPNATAMKPPSTEPVNGIDTWDLPACFRMSDEAIRDVTCKLPKGLHITHWSSVDLARQAVEDG